MVNLCFSLRLVVITESDLSAVATFFVKFASSLFPTTLRLESIVSGGTIIQGL